MPDHPVLGAIATRFHSGGSRATVEMMPGHEPVSLAWSLFVTCTRRLVLLDAVLASVSSLRRHLVASLRRQAVSYANGKQRLTPSDGLWKRNATHRDASHFEMEASLRASVGG